ncbi:MAG: cytochrome c oxidase subunit II [Halobacteriales archaeon]
MDIHRYESVWVVVSAVLIVAWIATVTYGAVGPGIAMVDESGGTADASSIAAEKYGQVEGFRAPGVYESGDGAGYEAYVVAYKFGFEPGSNEPITVPRGVEVTFYVTSQDVVHGFQLAGTNVNTMVIPGQIAEFTVAFEETGTYGLLCNEYCGAQHHEMAGQVEVVPQSEFEGGS